MAVLDWISIIALAYFALSGLLSGASALSTTLSFFATVYARSFISTTLVQWTSGLLTHFGVAGDYKSALALALAFLLFYLVARLAIRALLGAILPSAGIGRVIYALGSLLVNGYAYGYLLVSLLKSAMPLQAYLMPYFQGTYTLKLLESIYGFLPAV
jgi:hypothetical protein